jgi:hypothetical protein
MPVTEPPVERPRLEPVVPERQYIETGVEPVYTASPAVAATVVAWTPAAAVQPGIDEAPTPAAVSIAVAVPQSRERDEVTAPLSFAPSTPVETPKRVPEAPVTLAAVVPTEKPAVAVAVNDPSAKKPALPTASGVLPAAAGTLPPLSAAPVIGGMSLQEALQAARMAQR